MNLFILDNDLELNAQYHIDKHVSKMQLEAAQLLSTALWIDDVLGYVPRKLNSEELAAIKERKSYEPAIEERTFLRYLSCHENHPCSIWVRSSLDNFAWTFCYIHALNDESIWRDNKYHASCAETLKMPDPKFLTCTGLTPFAQAMPDELKNEDAVKAYRTYYRRDKASIASWKKRGQPDWWNK